MRIARSHETPWCSPPHVVPPIGHTAVDGCNAFTEVNLVDGAGSTPAGRAWIRLSVGTERRALTDVDAAQLLAVVWQGTGWCGMGTGDGWAGWLVDLESVSLCV